MQIVTPRLLLTPSLSENVTGSEQPLEETLTSCLPFCIFQSGSWIWLRLTQWGMSLVQLFNRTGFSFMFFVTKQAFWAAFIPPPNHELMLLCTVLVVPSIGVFSAVVGCWWELLAGCGLFSNKCPKGTWGNTRCRCFSLRIEDTLKADFH